MNGNMMGTLRQVLLRGLFFIAPLCLSIVILEMLYNLIDNSALGQVSAYVARHVLPQSWLVGVLADGHIPGLSLALTLLALLGLGLLAKSRSGQALLTVFDQFCLKIPLLRVIYAAVRKAINTMGDTNKPRFQKVVFLEWPTPGINTLAFVTSELELEGAEKHYVLFVPHMPNPTSGFIIVVAASKVKESSLTPGEALQFGMSFGVLSPPALLEELTRSRLEF